MTHKPWSPEYQLERLAMGAEPIEDAVRGLICRRCKTVRPLVGETGDWERNDDGCLLCPSCKTPKEKKQKGQTDNEEVRCKSDC